MIWTWIIILVGVSVVALVGVRYLSKRSKSVNSTPSGQSPSPEGIKFQKLSKISLWGLLRWVFIPSLIAWLIWGMVSCTSSCNNQIEQRVERIPTEGRFKWKQPPEVMIGGRILDEGSCNALVQVNNSNIWQIVLSDNRGRVDHLFWKKSEPYGSWDEVGSQDRGNWWLEKISYREYRGWITSIKYPGQKLQATLTLR